MSHMQALCAVNESRDPLVEPVVCLCFNQLHWHCFFVLLKLSPRAHRSQVLESSTYWTLHSVLKKQKKTSY